MKTLHVHGLWLKGKLKEDEVVITTPKEISEEFPDLERWVNQIIEIEDVDWEDELELQRDDSLMPECGFLLDPSDILYAH